ncbi:hypothetical protein [Streptomyces sp. NPDC021356]|uniref:hypothetical protein n=1 Tax=Streptomyces sp. NPDC021356 TaxID=3154900 RepID=UPI003411DB35
MGIRMLNHRPAVSHTAVGAAPAAPPPPVPALAADASTARIPTDFAVTLRRATRDLRRRLTPGARHPWPLWADVTRGYLALFLARLPHPVPARTVTVFVAAATTVPGHPSGLPCREPRPRTDRQDGQDHRKRPGHRDR